MKNFPHEEFPLMDSCERAKNPRNKHKKERQKLKWTSSSPLRLRIYADDVTCGMQVVEASGTKKKSGKSLRPAKRALKTHWEAYKKSNGIGNET